MVSIHPPGRPQNTLGAHSLRKQNKHLYKVEVNKIDAHVRFVNENTPSKTWTDALWDSVVIMFSVCVCMVALRSALLETKQLEWDVCVFHQVFS